MMSEISNAFNYCCRRVSLTNVFSSIAFDKESLRS